VPRRLPPVSPRLLPVPPSLRPPNLPPLILPPLILPPLILPPLILPPLILPPPILWPLLQPNRSPSPLPRRRSVRP